MSALRTASAAIFDPSAWLSAYVEAGGWWAFTDDRLWFGWPADPMESALALRRIYNEVQGRTDRLAAVRIAIEARAPT